MELANFFVKLTYFDRILKFDFHEMGVAVI